MAISSVSLTYFSMVSTPSANAPVGGVAPAANDSGVTKKASCDEHEPRRRNVLFDAMMSALRELGLPATPAAGTATGTTAAPATGTGTAATTASAPAADAAGVSGAASSSATASSTTPATAPSLEDAVLSFAHALWQALRGDEGSRHRRGGDDDDHHRHHHHHGHRHDRDYSRLASRVEALAVRIEAGGAGGSAVAMPSPIAMPPKLPGTDPVPMDSAAPAPADVVAPVVTTATKPTAPAVSGGPTKGSLAEAFAAMLKLLRGGDQTTGVPAPEASLANFLHSLARGLDADRSAPSMQVVGVMINVSA